MKVVLDNQPVVIDEQPVQVYFNYGTSEVDLLDGPATVRSVECIIRPFPSAPDQETEPFSTGVAQCSPLDNYSKVKGRLLAWRRATAHPRFTKTQRQELWAWFVSTCRLPDNTNY